MAVTAQGLFHNLAVHLANPFPYTLNLRNSELSRQDFQSKRLSYQDIDLRHQSALEFKVLGTLRHQTNFKR